jgi:aminoglycoside N3'-acetyltransferase
MKSLYNPNHVQEFISRINKITPTTQPQWGKMNAVQVMAHCAAPLKMAHGEVKSKRGLFSLLLGKYFKNKMVNPEVPFTRNLPTDPNFIFPDAKEFEDEKSKLVGKLNEFVTKGKAGITKQPHSFFGYMSPEEWDILQSKHLDHHLRQFGV